MEAANYLPPSKMARFSDPGILSLPSTGLGLGLGLGPSEKSAFTFLQLQELEHQALIFKYMVAGVPVPFHLVLPIWKSVVNSTAGTYKNQPAWLGHGNLCFDYRNSIEPEPGRCRRTDGKKWRCSKDVVPDQKYCERHMHRGRHRSRKHVDGNNSAANNPNSDKNLTKTATDSSTHLSISIPVGLQLMTNNSTTSTSTNTNTTQRSGFSPTSVLLHPTPCKAESCL